MIYPVRPLDCHSQLVTAGVSKDQCFHCPHTVGNLEAEAEGRRLVGELVEKEKQHGVPALPAQASRNLGSVSV